MALGDNDEHRKVFPAFPLGGFRILRLGHGGFSPESQNEVCSLV